MSIVGDIAGLVGSENAEDAQFAMLQQQLAALEQGFQRAKKQYKPFRDFGTGGMGLLSRLYGIDDGTADMSAFTASPDYQFRLQQGANALQGAAAARGGLFSGATGKALSEFNQNTAAQEFDNYVNRLFGMTNIGQNAATGIANAATGNATNMANVYGQIGQNQATGIMNQANALGGLADAGAAALYGGLFGIPGVANSAGSQGFMAGLMG